MYIITDQKIASEYYENITKILRKGVDNISRCVTMYNVNINEVLYHE